MKVNIHYLKETRFNNKIKAINEKMKRNFLGQKSFNSLGPILKLYKQHK